MRVGLFTLTILAFVFLLAVLNAAWIGRLIKSPMRRWFYGGYASLTLISASAYVGIRWTGAFESPESLLPFFYLGPFWAVLQLLLLIAWPVSRIVVWIQYRMINTGSSITVQEVSRQPDSMLSRRAFLSRAAMIPPLAMTGVNALGMADAELNSILRRIELQYRDLPMDLDGLSIGHMTDVHIGPYVSLRDIQKMWRHFETNPPDILAITGDFVDEPAKLSAALDIMSPLLDKIRLGSWFCMGNHEHFRGAALIRRTLGQYGIHILDNRHQALQIGSTELFIAGVDYPMHRDAAGRKQAAEGFLSQACFGIPEKGFSLLLAHHPDFLPGAFARNIDLTLAGHTHGGQVGWGDRSLFSFVHPYMRGIYRDQSSLAYVSSGAGHWLPFRLNCPPEVTLLTLKRAG